MGIVGGQGGTLLEALPYSWDVIANINIEYRCRTRNQTKDTGFSILVSGLMFDMAAITSLLSCMALARVNQSICSCTSFVHLPFS